MFSSDNYPVSVKKICSSGVICDGNVVSERVRGVFLFQVGENFHFFGADHFPVPQQFGRVWLAEALVAQVAEYEGLAPNEIQAGVAIITAQYDFCNVTMNL